MCLEGWQIFSNKALGQLFEVQTKLFISFTNAILTWKYRREANYGYSDLGIWEISWKWVSLSLQRKWLTVFVASEIFKWKFEFWKACIHHHELASFLTFLIGLVALQINVIFWYWMIKCVNIWKDMNQYFPLLQNHAW